MLFSLASSQADEAGTRRIGLCSEMSSGRYRLERRVVAGGQEAFAPFCLIWPERRARWIRGLCCNLRTGGCILRVSPGSEATPQSQESGFGFYPDGTAGCGIDFTLDRAGSNLRCESTE